MSEYANYYEAARRLGFRITPDAVGLMTSAICMYGSVGATRVELVRRIGRGPTTTVTALLDPPLDLGLVIRKSGLVASAQELFGAVDVIVGDEDVDATFAIRGDEPERVRALFGERFRNTIRVMKDAPLEVTDRKIELVYGVDAIVGTAETLDFVTAAIEGAATLAREIDAARAAVPPAAGVSRFAPGLEKLAAERGLTSDFHAPSRVFGSLGEVWASISTHRKGKGELDLEVIVRPAEPFPFRFVIAAKATGIATWFAGEDLQLGHAELDAAYDVRTESPDRLKAMVDPSLAEELFQLGDGRKLRLDERGLSVIDAAGDFDPAALPAVVERAASLLSGLARMDRLGAGQGYR